MPKKLSDDFTKSLKYRNDLSRVKSSKNDHDLTTMDYIFLMEKQIQDLYKMAKKEDENG
ncbi:MAG: hypothetical protein J6U54_10985 [Clostridiales bacterium]|nr:hypothetical protein [Clostridiales bacterium]